MGLPGAGRGLRALLQLLAPQAWDGLVDQHADPLCFAVG